ncbi:MAG: single-stranded DNA-binding protein [Patescibacteria group bacterium]|jgi:single-strand DNA-binding protein
MNKVFLIGRLGKDPETKTAQSGKAVTKFTLATDSGWGEKKTTDWHNVVCFDKTAETAAKYLGKGRQCCIEGRISYRTWDKEDGTKGYMTEIICDRLELLADGATRSQPEATAAALPDDAIPF